jgi:hypothetical protein
MITFDQAVLQAGDDVTITSDTGGTYHIESGLSLTDGQWQANPGEHFTLGQGSVGGFAINISDPDVGFYFSSLIFILPDNGHLTLGHIDNNPPAAFDEQPFANDILSKFIEVLTGPNGGNYLQAGLHAAAEAFPQDAAAAVTDTLVLAMVFFPEATVPFLISSAVGTVVEFFGHVNESVIDGMVSGGDLTAPEGTFLKFAFGMHAVLGGLQSLVGDQDLEQAKSALETYDSLHDLSSAADEMNYGLRFKTTDVVAPTAAVVIHINKLP